MQRFIEDDFDEHQSTTIGVDFKTKIISIDGVKVKLTIWDTAGQVSPTYFSISGLIIRFMQLFPSRNASAH